MKSNSKVYGIRVFSTRGRLISSLGDSRVFASKSLAESYIKEYLECKNFVHEVYAIELFT